MGPQCAQCAWHPPLLQPNLVLGTELLSDSIVRMNLDLRKSSQEIATNQMSI